MDVYIHRRDDIARPADAFPVLVTYGTNLSEVMGHADCATILRAEAPNPTKHPPDFARIVFVHIVQRSQRIENNEGWFHCTDQSFEIFTGFIIVESKRCDAVCAFKNDSVDW